MTINATNSPVIRNVKKRQPASHVRSIQPVGSKLSQVMTINATNSPVIGNVKKDSQLPMSVPSSLLEASCLRDLEHNCSEEMIIMIMIMMTRKNEVKVIISKSWTENNCLPLAGRHLLEVENCKIASFSMVFLSPPNCVYSHWHNLSPTGWMECIYWWEAPKISFIYLCLFFHFHFPNDRR